jgi:hypothetical protein
MIEHYALQSSKDGVLRVTVRQSRKVTWCVSKRTRMGGSIEGCERY